MSIFSSIKGKIANVQQDLSNSRLLSFRSTKQDERKPRCVQSKLVNFHAGASLLSNYQKCWSDVHRMSEENVLKAQDVDSLATGIFLHMEQQNAAINQFVCELMTLSEIVTQVNSIKDKITSLEESFGEIESMLLTLEDVCDEVQTKKNKIAHEFQLNKHQQRKHVELEQAKVEMAQRHASKVHQFEMELSSSLRERQKVFEAAFIEQMQNYKASGQVDEPSVVLPAVSDSSTPLDLADIVVEDDTSVLDDFLSSTELKHSEPDGSTVAEHLQSENCAKLASLCVTDSETVDESVTLEGSREPVNLSLRGSSRDSGQIVDHHGSNGEGFFEPPENQENVQQTDCENEMAKQ